MVCFCVYISYICGYCECSLLPVNDHLILLIYVFLSNGTIFNDLDDYTQIVRRYASSVYIVLWPRVRLFVCLVRGRGTARRQVVQRTRVTTSFMRPTATHAQQWRGLSIHEAYCYWGYGQTTGWPTCRLRLAFLVVIIIACALYQSRCVRVQNVCLRESDHSCTARAGKGDRGQLCRCTPLLLPVG